jgi:hypothetical protein
VSWRTRSIAHGSLVLCVFVSIRLSNLTVSCSGPSPDSLFPALGVSNMSLIESL